MKPRLTSRALWGLLLALGGGCRPADSGAGPRAPAVQERLAPLIGTEIALGTTALGPAAGKQAAPAVAWNGTHFFAVWQDERDGQPDVFGARVTAAGVVVDVAGLAIATGPEAQLSPDVAWDGTTFLVVWVEKGSLLRASRVTPAGALLDGPGLVLAATPGAKRAPRAAWNGSKYLVVWEEDRNGTDSGLFAVHVSPAGVVLDAPGLTISDAVDHQAAPAVASDGTGFLVAWQDARGTNTDVYAARVSAGGALLESAGLAVSTSGGVQSAPSVAWSGANYVLAWQDTRNSNPDVYAARVSAAGTVLDPTGVAVSTASQNEQTPAVGCDAANCLVTWSILRSGTRDVMGVRLGSTLTLLDASPLAVGAGTADQTAPRLATSGTDYLAVWADTRRDTGDAYGARVSTQGTVRDTAGVLLSSSANRQRNAALAWGASGGLAVWEDERNGNVDVYGTRLELTGAVLDPQGIAISTATGAQTVPSVAWTGADFLVVWADARTDVNDVFGARVSASGAVRDPDGIAVAVATGTQRAPAVAWNGVDGVVAWQDTRNGPATIFAARIAASGAVLDPAGIALAPSATDQANPTLAPHGTGVLVVWEDLRNDSSRDLYGARLDVLGTVLDPLGLPLMGGTADHRTPRLASDATSAFVTWTQLQASRADVLGARVGTTGALLDDAGIALATSPATEQRPSVAWDGTHYVVAWEEVADAGAVSLRAARVTPGGTLQGGASVRVPTTSPAPAAPAVACLPSGHCGLAWDAFDQSPTAQVRRALAALVLVNQAPVAEALALTTPMNAPLAFTLTASDPEGAPLAFRVETSPQHGTLQGTAPALTYTPATGYVGSDEFSFVANDGALDSPPALVSVTVTPTAQPDAGSLPDAGAAGPDGGGSDADAGTNTPDAGMSDPDAGTNVPDAGMSGPDAGSNDPDAGTNDPDAGTNDPDAGTNDPDAGTNDPDAGANDPDAGKSGPDAGTNDPDAGVGSDDAGVGAPRPPWALSVGCACDANSGAPTLPLLLLSLWRLGGRRRAWSTCGAARRLPGARLSRP